ncbi:hypothetical protein [Archangium sp.]|uniref:hypothetical protein n=1 Tax=Archangium sp. TaxID=1872627 RepID=UPI002ED9BC03
MTHQGPLSLEDYTWTVKLCRELGQQQAFILVTDVTELTASDPEGQRYASEHMEPEWFVAIIYVGARLIHKAGAKGIRFVQQLLGRKPTPLYFAANEAEARRIISQLRST